MWVEHRLRGMPVRHYRRNHFTVSKHLNSLISFRCLWQWTHFQDTQRNHGRENGPDSCVRLCFPFPVSELFRAGACFLLPLRSASLLSPPRRLVPTTACLWWGSDVRVSTGTQVRNPSGCFLTSPIMIILFCYSEGWICDFEPRWGTANSPVSTCPRCCS